MREILFRGKRIDNSEWVYGYYTPACFGRFPCKSAIVPEPNGVWEPIAVKLETVGQYTGLTDKNGKKIFEGDIIFDPELKENHIVMFDEGGFCTEEMFLQSYLCFGEMEIEVICNIHDNPELLEVAK